MQSEELASLFCLRCSARAHASAGDAHMDLLEMQRHETGRACALNVPTRRNVLPRALSGHAAQRFRIQKLLRITRGRQRGAGVSRPSLP